MAKTKINPADKARSVVVQGIYGCLDRRRWTSRQAIVDQIGDLIPDKKAIEVFDKRIGKGKPFPKAHKVAEGRKMRVLLDCITLVKYGKIVQRGRGDSKEYKLA